MYPDFEKAEKLIMEAAESGRFALFEHEVYDILSAVGIGTPPVYRLIHSPDDSLDSLKDLPGDRLVLKIEHPRIVHKTEVGGIKIVPREQAGEAIRSLFNEAPRNQARFLIDRGEVPEEFRSLSPDDLADRLKNETGGVLASEFVESEPGFGHELFIGMRLTREFGPVINCGLGGLDTELFAKEIGCGRAGVTLSPGISTDADLVAAFKTTIAFETLTGLARGHRGVISEEKIADLVERFHALVWRFSQLNPDARYWLTECEVNPVLCSHGMLAPVDGLLRFRPAEIAPPDSPNEKIENLLKPKNICVIGVSAKGMNLGRVILRNLLNGDFTPETLAIVKEGDAEIDGVKCYPSIAELPSKFDMIVLSIDVHQVPGAVREIVEHEKAESIILITGGMGEKSGAESLEDELRRVLMESRSRDDRGPVMVGGNSLGIISRPGGYDTMFVPQSKLPRNLNMTIGGKIALISQSGAFIITRMSRLGGLVPRYAISTGNQVDLGLADFLEYLASDDELKVFGCYVEGFKPGEGLKFAEMASKITGSGKDVIVYRAGRSTEGRRAASGHTGAIAGDSDVAEAVLSSSGCMVARSFSEFTNLLMLSAMLAGRDVGLGRLAALSNAGYEAVGIADNLRGDDYELKLAELSDETKTNLLKVLEQFRLKELQDIRNPMDLTPMAVDRAHVEIIRAFAADPNADILLHACVPLSIAMKTREPGGPEGDGIADPESFAQLLINAHRAEIRKPLAVVIDSGSLYDPMAEMFMEAGIPVFRSADEAVKVLGKWVGAKLRRA